MEQILGALEQAKACKGKPTCLILNTVKGKGATFAEPSGAHSSQPTKEQWMKRLPHPKPLWLQ